ncbi:MAG: aromatic ring-hydroxylating oxygenase subunit alpha [Gammaproteobacteria bacterium]
MNVDWLAGEWLRMRRRMLACIAEGRSDMSATPLALDARVYTDPARLALERSVLFRRTPLLAGLSCQLREPGSVLLFEEAGEPVFLHRRADGAIGAFLNRCPHRGARLVGDTRSRDAFVCPFHAWRFDATGRLLARPLDEAFACEGARPAALTALPVAEKHGLIFLRLDPAGGPIDIDAFLGPIATLIAAFELAASGHAGQDSLPAAANWKLVVDVSCEGYHVPATHPQTLSPQLVPFLTIHDSYGLHHRFASPSRHLAALAGRPEAEWPAGGYSAVHYLFPNAVLTVSDAIDGSLPVIALNRSFPGENPGEARVVYDSYRPADAPAGDYAALHAMILGINRSEDLPMVEGVWRNYARAASPAPIVFGRNEQTLQRYHAAVAELIGMPLAGPAAITVSGEDEAGTRT